MLDWIMQPWPWYISGPLIGLTVPLLLLLTGKKLGISRSFQHIGSICTPQSKFPYIHDNDWRKHSWNLIFVLGVVIGGFVGARFLTAAPVAYLPETYHSAAGVIKLIIGGILVGFGVRYANGCTSGHTIMGLSLLQWPSLVATIAFFVGGLITTHLLSFLF